MKRLFAMLLLPLAAHATDVKYSRNADSNLETWLRDAKGFSMHLTQISPDQAQAFFLARGFPEDAAKHYADTCVFMTVSRNTGKQPVSYDLADWQFRSAGGQWQPLKVKEDWMREWTERRLAQPARIAFEWSQHPTRQDYAPGDWNQGMTTYALPRGSRFDLRYTWTRQGKHHDGQIENIRCAD